MFFTQVTNIKKTLKTSQQDTEEQMVTDSSGGTAQPEKVSKKSSKSKGFVLLTVN